MKILCKIGLHRPLKITTCEFIDNISGKEVFNATCSCGQHWLTDSIFGWFGTTMKKESHDPHNVVRNE